ncbi:MAG: peptidoglycan DD-metalloendopeptidase family protein [Actinomycetota bacterium]|nr:peptidoglycan DD-metalloendopeptidase family protein [Actinomycetota bacterium]
MKRLVFALALALVSVAGTASADTFRAVPTGPSALPSAEVPNQPGQIALPPNMSSQPAQPEVLSFAQLELLWQSAGASYGIPWQVLGAINKVESNFGRNMGPSSAGAVGWMQFMPDTWYRWGLDADGDGLANPWVAQDAVYAAARYLAASGGRTDISRAIFSYNHAQWYVDEVLQLAKLFGSGGVDGTFRLDRVQQSIDQARGGVVAVNRKLIAALRVEARLARIARTRERRVAASELVSDQISAQRVAVQASAKVDHAHTRVEELRAQLQDAEATLERAHTQVRTLPASAAGSSFFDAPASQSGYVFPVGGGPSIVSVGHTHHDYPAADIAAPEGTPVYALADAVVIKAWSSSQGSCGIGLTIETSDRQSWTYCHLAYLEPSVQQGSVLPAGTPVGLVGQTGHATGPHLHLQLNPTTSYPQQQPWFQSFAGSAFRWSDAPTPAAAPATSGPVFAVVPPSRDTQSENGVVRFTR